MMTEAKKILDMIERVSLEHDYTLDKIDAMVGCYVSNKTYHHNDFERVYCNSSGTDSFHFEAYTRSRDALKGIRPEGWWLDGASGPIGWAFSFKRNDLLTELESAILPTEELAELHAIIQAIEWERNQ